MAQSPKQSSKRSFLDGFIVQTTRLPDAVRERFRAALARQPPGAAAGLDVAHPSVSIRPEPGQVTLTVFDFGPETLLEATFDAADNLDLPPRRAEMAVRWVDVVGLHPHAVAQLQRQLGFHTLTAEDILHVGQRPRLEVYDDYLYLPLQMTRVADGVIITEQVSLFVFQSQVVTFQERTGDVWDPLRSRLRRPGTRVRRNSADYLAYALLDAVVDNAFPVVENYGLMLETLEMSILQHPMPGQLQDVQNIRWELGVLRRSFGPLRKALESFTINEVVPLKKQTRTFVRDVLGHADQLVDLVASYWDVSGGLTDLYMSVASHRMNQVMKVLTILSAIFIPLTFLAGVYGMNLAVLPGSTSPAAFWWFMAACGGVSALMLAVFWVWGWFERGR